MPKYLVIVESPAKAKTIERFLGKDYTVVASYGHIRDLPNTADEIPADMKDKPWARMAVDTENDFTPIYVVSGDSKKRVAELRKLVKGVDEIVLATDEDREGEAISWHLIEALKPKVPISRIAFHEITKTAIDEALASPRKVNTELVKAQEGRRILDRLFGYSLSPVLWRKVRPKLSAGRVQSVALRLVVEREEARRAFCKAEYWDVDATLQGKGIEFTATLAEWDGKRPASGKDFDADSGELAMVVNKKTGEAKAVDVAWLHEKDANDLAAALTGAVPWRAAQVDQKKAKMRPYPPLITSTLQQSASSLLGFAPRKTMMVAQKLYEGIDLGGGEREGLITYMRTDSVVLSGKALAQAGQVIKEKFGERYHQVRKYKTKSKSAQEAHEAIRPTELTRTPEQLTSRLDKDELALYRIIWNRTIACQMADAELLKTTVDFEADVSGKRAVLRSNGSVVTFPGYLTVADSSQKDSELPPIEEGQQVVAADGVDDAPANALTLVKTEGSGHETKPPARFTEAALIRQLEEEGIGRPSTYAPTISTIQQRNYVSKKGSALVPTIVGIAVIFILRKHFAEYVDIKFTVRMEDALDNIANGDQDRTAFLKAFYKGDGKFGKGLEPQIEHELPNIDFPNIPIGTDPETGEAYIVRVGRTHPYVQRGEGGDGNTAGLPDEVTYDELTVDLAKDLIKAQAKAREAIGTHPETGQNIYVLVGPYGPYIQLGEVEAGSKKKPKRASLLKGTDVTEVDLASALHYLSLPRDLGRHPESNKKMSAAIGPYGPYVRCDKEYRSLKEDDVFTVTPERAVFLLAQPKAKRGRAAKKILVSLGNHPESGDTIEVLDGRYGAYVSDGSTNATIPKDSDPTKVTLEQAVELLANAPKKKKKKKKAAKKKKKAAAKKKKAPAKKKAAAKKKAPAKKPE
jgi:DNA topoisomerase-1